MKTEETDLAQRALDRRRREDAAIAVPALGVLLLVSPLANIFAGKWFTWGMPATYIHVFVVWLGLILITRSLARRLIAAERSGPPTR
jgi:hypothetical protein